MGKRSIWPSLLVGLLIGIAAASPLARQAFGRKPEPDDQEFLERLEWFVETLEDRYVEEVDRDKLLVGLYQGMLRAADPYGTYLPPEVAKALEGEQARAAEVGVNVTLMRSEPGPVGGVGVDLAAGPGRRALVVERAIAGTPAFRAGILAGDLIVELREEATGAVMKAEEFETVFDAIRALRGEPGTKVALKVLHAYTGKTEEVSVTRKVVTTPGVGAAQMVDPEHKVVYIRIPHFGETIAEDLTQAVRRAQSEGAESLVLDLRFSTGGTVDAAAECADLFIEDEPITSVRASGAVQKTYRGQRDPIIDHMPLVLLTNRHTAGAAEVFAAALRDHGKAVLVGETTLGMASVLGRVQSPFDDSAIELTFARYYTPKDKLIEGKGVEPNVEIELSGEDTGKLAVHMSENVAYPLRRQTGPSEEGPDAGGARAPEEFEDVQLVRAIDVLLGRGLAADSEGEPVAEVAGDSRE